MATVSPKIIELAKIKKRIAQKHRDNVWGLIELAMSFTSPNESTIKDDTSQSTHNDKTKATYDSTAIVESSKLSKKLVNMFFPSSIQYAGLSTNTNENAQVKDTIQKYGEITYKMLITSNLDKEVLNYIQNWSTIGTGALRMIYTGDPISPIRFKHLPLKNLMFAEDGFSRPNHVFFTNPQMTIDQIKQVWNSKYNFDGLNEEEEMDVMESVYFETTTGLEGKYHYIVSDTTYERIYHYAELDYNPFIVTRYKRFTDGSVWGCGEALNCLTNIININITRRLIRILGKKLIKPALMGWGDRDIISKLKFELGKVTYGGTLNSTHFEPVMNGTPNVELITVDKDEQTIKQTFYSDYMSQVANDSGVRTAYEWSLRHKEFMDVFSPNYSMFEAEGLKPIFLNSFNILLSFGYKGMDAEYIADKNVETVFKNKLTDNNNFEKIEKFDSCFSHVAKLYGIAVALMSANVPNGVELLYDLYDVDRKFIKDKGEYAEQLEAYIQNVIQAQQPQTEQPPQEEDANGVQ
jgi:hypothetical protein